jgi:hypothetical protein
VVQEGSNLKVLSVTEGCFIDYCGRRRECGTGGEQHEGGACNDLLIVVGAGENVVQEGSNMKAVLVMIY